MQRNTIFFIVVKALHVSLYIVIGQIALCGILLIIERNYCSELNLNGRDHTA